MSYQAILYEKADRIARITLNRPEKLNALNTQLKIELIDAVTDSGHDDDIRVIVIKGAGRAFSAGYDLSGEYTSPSGQAKAAARAEPSKKKEISDFQRMSDGFMDNIIDPWTKLWNSRKPVISQVHGYCLAGATDLALHTDIVICSDDAKFGMPAARAQGTQPTHMWTYLVGPQWAKYILYTGNSVDGKTAERIGLVLKSVPSDELEAEVNHLAETIARVPYGLLTLHKRIVNMTLEMMGRGLVQRLAAEGDAMGHLDPMAIEFDRISATRGLKEALDWRDAGFGDYRASSTGKQGD